MDWELAVANPSSLPVLRIRIWDPVPLWPLDPGSGLGKNRIRDDQPGSYFRELRNQFLKYFNYLIGIRDPGWKKFGSGMENIRIRDKHPGSAPLSLQIERIRVHRFQKSWDPDSPAQYAAFIRKMRNQYHFKYLKLFKSLFFIRKFWKCSNSVFKDVLKGTVSQDRIRIFWQKMSTSRS